MENKITFWLLVLGSIALLGMAMICVGAALFKGAIMHLMTSSIYGLFCWLCVEKAYDLHREMVDEERRRAR